MFGCWLWFLICGCLNRNFRLDFQEPNAIHGFRFCFQAQAINARLLSSAYLCKTAHFGRPLLQIPGYSARAADSAVCSFCCIKTAKRGWPLPRMADKPTSGQLMVAVTRMIHNGYPAGKLQFTSRKRFWAQPKPGWPQTR